MEMLLFPSALCVEYYYFYFLCTCIHFITERNLIGLITVFDAILTGRQSSQKLQCLYRNPIANNFFQN